MYAVIKTGGKQYRVTEGQKITVDKIQGEPGVQVNFNEVLLVSNDQGLNIGMPNLDSASVTGKISKQFRDEKIIVFKKKRRHNYRRKQGHRQYLTEVEIQQIKQA